MGRILPILQPFSYIIIIFGVLMLLPAGVAWLHEDNTLNIFCISAATVLLFGAILWAVSKKIKRKLHASDGFLLVAVCWVILPVFGAMPIYLYIDNLSMVAAYFEGVSGLTATGATVLSGLDAMAVSFNLWRTFLHWIGGMGIIVLVVAILPLLGIGGRQLFKVEVPTPMKETSLTPRIAETAKGLWMTYSLLTLACMLGLWLAGMDGWDAVIHSFSVIGLGGFSSHDDGLGYYDSLGVEMVVIFFALCSGLNYATHYMAMRRCSYKPYLQDPELPFYFATLGFSIFLVAACLLFTQTFDQPGVALRYAAFQVVSISTSLGIASTDYSVWPVFVQLWLLFLGSFLACSGSTGGGIKMMRAIILYRQVYRELIKALHPNVIQPVKLGRQAISENILHAVLGFSFMYMVSIVILTLVMTATGVELVTALSAVVACLNNTGPGMAAVGPTGNYAGLSQFQLGVLSFTMILGRLEIFTLLVVLTPVFWRK